MNINSKHNGFTDCYFVKTILMFLVLAITKIEADILESVNNIIIVVIDLCFYHDDCFDNFHSTMGCSTN